MGPNDQRIGDETREVATAAAFLAFHAPDTSSWAAGDDKVEIHSGDELAISESFDIVSEAPKA